MSSRPNLKGGVGQPAKRPRGTRRAASIRRLHALLGIVSALNLLLLITTGLLLQHIRLFHLDDRMVSRRVLPTGYRPQDGPEGVRADIVITDLHSGRILGTTGTAILDVITLGWFVMLVTGVIMYTARANGRRKTRYADDGGPGPRTRGSQNSQAEIEGNNEASDEVPNDSPQADSPQTTGDAFRALQCCRGCRRLVCKDIVAMYLNPEGVHAALRALGSLWTREVRAPASGKTLLVVQAYRCRDGHCHLVCRGAADLRRTEQSAVVLFEAMAEAAGVQPESRLLRVINERAQESRLG